MGMPFLCTNVYEHYLSGSGNARCASTPFTMIKFLIPKEVWDISCVMLLC